MSLTGWLQTLLSEIQSTPLLEWLGVGFGVAEVLLAKSNKVLLYPAGIISVVISSFIFFRSGLYAESLLNAYYLIMSIYGWAVWVKRKHQPGLHISKASGSDWLVTLSISLLGFALLAFLLHRFTQSDVPYWDAWVSATAWAGMWLLARRKLENWLLLNLSNAFAVPLLIHKHLPLYALLTVFLFFIAVQGYFSWKKMLAHPGPSAAPSKQI
ncbi:MAG: nicotinamide mononucleotide transporter [Bacteroidetes bacterium]|nr:nicotinamide mononucleotide transporter [Bacteroidota bacterium]MBS1630714.1 nicotinamide mononucleotide transporter [Bacteroidota bacterium]